MPKRSYTSFEGDDQTTAPTFGCDFRSDRDLWAGNTFRAGGDIHINAATCRHDPNDVTPSGDATELGRRFLQSLYFPEMDRRQNHIASLVDEFGLTCKWLVTAKDDNNDFVNWCRNGDSIFWINSLPGTGKSTLMDFLAGHLEGDDNRDDLFCAWASSTPVQLLTFFFYSSKDSTKLQNSFAGLWRSLCFQILHDDEDMLKRLLNDVSVPLPVKRMLSVLKRGLEYSWSNRDLRECFKYLVTSSPRKFFCLLDGLDEFEKDQSELAEVIQDLAYQGLRFCCASRPVEPFRTVFRSCTSIRLEDINAGDIRNFCSRKLANSRAVKLADRIVRMSEGVFLWAAIVTLDLRRAAFSADETELSDRLNHFLSGRLTDLYEHNGEAPAQRYIRSAESGATSTNHQGDDGAKREAWVLEAQHDPPPRLGHLVHSERPIKAWTQLL